GRRAKNPVTNRELPILPSEFVDAGNATGVVMSVPAHAPYDWAALEEFKAKNEEERFGVLKEELEPISLVITEGFGENPAKEICEQMKITSTRQIKELDDATSLLYKKEFHTGILNESCGPYQGMKVSEVKDKIVMDFIEKEISDPFYDVNNVVCRCTTKCHVKILENQWFLKFSDSKWKSKARKCVKNMDIYPEEARVSFLNTIDWLKDKACARKSGLGTKMPWDREWIIETLSDSTIYMAYYTIAKTINEKKINAKNLTDDVFNFVFLGKGNINKIAKAAKLNRKIIMEMKKEFDYFYPVDMRNSGKDNLHNHLIFYIFHHTALWKEKKWPKAIGVNGYVKIEKDKMSKSKGNVLPLADAIKNYGADMTRINIVSAGEGMYDAEWHVENIKSLRNRYDFLFDIIKEMDRAKSGKRSTDAYIENKINECINNTKESYECLNFRSGVQTALFESTNALRWYLRRVGDIKYANMKTLHESIKKITLMLAPITPHLCEELWSMLGEKGFVSLEKWPKARKIKENYNLSENFIKQIIDDAEEIKKIANISKPKTITLFIAEDWKFGIYKKVFESSKDVNEIIKEIMSSGKYGKATVFFIQNLYKRKNELKEILQKDEQFKILEEAKRFIESETKCAVHLLDADKSENQKAKNSSPQKPGILIE
ncbi:MAG TPA: leucine--tRNA ligase, partial [archaeon]|nr:leucine--tRNA ligase [archaeon]